MSDGSSPTPDAREAKRVLRQRYLALRRAMSHEEWRAQSDAIAKKVLSLPEMQRAPTVLTYVSSKDNEVDTIVIMEALLREGRRVGVPRVTGPGWMEWRLIDSMQALEAGQFGVLEPAPVRTELYEDYRKEDVCLVPGVVWDKKGYRIGYGLGFFDRFLSQFTGISVGLAFHCQVCDGLVTEPHDVAVSRLVS